MYDAFSLQYTIQVKITHLVLFRIFQKQTLKLNIGRLKCFLKPLSVVEPIQ